MSTYGALISGTDLRGVALGDKASLTHEVAELVGKAYALWVSDRIQLPKNDRICIAVGRDSRLSGENLLSAFSQGIAKQGLNVIDCGICTTPAMFKCLTDDEPLAHASVMITASHHPSDRNGFKFFMPQGGINAHELAEIVSLMDEDIEPSLRYGAIERYHYLDDYTEQLKDMVRIQLDDPVIRPLLGLHVIVDAGNGAGGFYAKMLEDLGAWTEGSQFLEPDGNFPNHAPNPEDSVAIRSLSEAVLKHSADLGVIFDADCDRAAIVDQNGLAINRNRLIALVSAMLLNEHSGLTIVTDSVTSSGLSQFIGEWGGEHYRYKRGYRNVIDEAKRLNEMGIDCPLAIETSGHAAFRDNQFLDDGMYLSTLLVCECMRLKREGKTLSSLLDGLKEPVESIELRLNIKQEDFRSAGIRVIEAVMDYASEAEGWNVAPDNREGVRISFDLEQQLNNAWFLLRMSVHDPVLALNVESDIEGGLFAVLSSLYGSIGHLHDIVDLKPIEDALDTMKGKLV